MKLLKITTLLLTITLLSNCAFLPSIVMSSKKRFDTLKDNLGEIPPFEEEATEEAAEEDSTYMNEAPEMETFDFESVECLQASFFLDKMNVIYVGIENPCRIFVTNVSNEYVEVSSDNENLEIIEKEGGFYTLIANEAGMANITVSAGYYEETYEVQMKQIPNPVAKLGIKEGGNIKISAFKAEKGISAWLVDFDFDTRCMIESYAMTRIAKDGRQETVENEGAEFNNAATLLYEKAQSGDIYIFENIRSKCVGDEESRPINSLVFRIE
jgi:hypothetical protein